MSANDPYAGLGTVEQTRDPYAGSGVAEQDPYAGLGTVEAAPKAGIDPFAQLQQMLDSGATKPQLVAKAKELGLPTMREDLLDASLAYRARGGRARIDPSIAEPDNSLNQWAGVGTRAFAPYATAATLGAAAGAPFAGVGAIPGAAGGVLSLGLTDLGTSVYNAFAPTFGGQRVPTGSEAIQNLYGNVGIGRRPETPGQQVFSDTLQGLAGGVAQPAAMGAQAARMAPSLTRNILNVLSEQRAAQAAGAAGAAAAPSIAQNYFNVTDPAALMALSLAGGMVAGAAAAPRPRTVTSEQLAARARSAYDRAEQAGVQFDPTSVSNLGSSIRQAFTTHPRVQFDPSLHPRINTALQRIEEVANTAQQSGTPISFSQVELLRRIARTAANSLDRDERRLGADVIRRIDDFVQAPPPRAIIAGQGPEAAQAITEARTAWRRMSQADALDTMVDRATNSAQGLNASSLRAQARTIANNPNRMRSFDRDIQNEIQGLARGNRGLSTLQTVGQLAPSFNFRNLPGSAVTAGAGSALYSGSPGVAALGAGLGATGLAARTAANRMATGRMAGMSSRARGTPEREIPVPQIATQSAQQALLNAEFPEVDPETGQFLMGIGEIDGQRYPMYGPRNNNAMRR